MEYIRKNSGVCSKSTRVVIEDGKIQDAEIIGGCNGNLKGITTLIIGMDAKQVAEKMKGITCGLRSTSCPDQLAITIEEALAKS